MTTLRELKTAAQSLGYSVSKRDGEYRVAPYRPADPRWCEDRAYYTDDIEDAKWTLMAMATHGATAGLGVAALARGDADATQD